MSGPDAVQLARVGRSVAAARGLDLADLEGRLDWAGFGRACSAAMARLRPCPEIDGFISIPSSSGEPGASLSPVVAAGAPTATAVQSVAAPLPSPTSLLSNLGRRLDPYDWPATGPGAVEASVAMPGGVATLPGHSGQLRFTLELPPAPAPAAGRGLALLGLVGLLGLVAGAYGPLAALAGVSLGLPVLAAGLLLRLEAQP